MSAAPRLHYAASGSGTPAILQGPAWGPSSDYLRLTLVPLLEGLRVVSYDPRNVGLSPRIDGERAQATELLVADLELLREHLGFGRFVLLGHSHGGLVALAYAVRYPARVGALILLDTALQRSPATAEVEEILAELGSDPARQEALRVFRETGGEPVGLHSDAELARWVRRLMPLYFYDLAAMRRFQHASRKATAPSAVALRSMPEAPEVWIEEGVARIEAPTLVLGGSHDIAAPPSQARRIHELLPSAELVILERCGHHPWAERPRAFRDAVARFLARVDRAYGSL